MVNITFKNNKALIVVDNSPTRQEFVAARQELEVAMGIIGVDIDLARLEHIKSDQLAGFIMIRKVANSNQIPIVLFNVSDNVYRILQTSDTIKLFTIGKNYEHSSTDDLIKMFANVELADGASDHLAKHYNSEVRAELIKRIAADKPNIQACCLLTIGKACDTDSIDLVRSCLDSPHTQVTCAAIHVLGWFGDMESKDRLYDFILSPTKALAEAAGSAVALLSDDGDLVRLVELASSNKPEVRGIVVRVLALIGGENAFAKTANMLALETDVFIRKTIARCLSRFNTPQTVDLLVKLLDDKSMAVQEAAASGLGCTGLNGNESVVISKIKSPNIWVGYFAVRALGHSVSPETAKILIEAYPSVHSNIKLAIIEVLGHTHLPEAITLLETQLQGDNEDVRREALSALYVSGKKQTAKLALNIAETDQSWMVRYRAVEIIENEHPDGYIDVLRRINETEQNRFIKEKIALVLGI
ncbi:hypothetical protein RsTz2092_01940 [Deferribacterales bacterium RsTz2092]|nr:hypothetical protein AGMMS49941_02230 [Deferribacterales bacterium]